MNDDGVAKYEAAVAMNQRVRRAEAGIYRGKRLGDMDRVELILALAEVGELYAELLKEVKA